jgi:cell pole-organizing protein PopZ
MVLGWGKKTVTKHDEEDMTMDEILASIRRYVTEDQNPQQRDTQPVKQQSAVPRESTRFEPSPPLQSNFESAPSVPQMTNYDEPYSTNEMLQDQAAMNETPLSSYVPEEPYFGGMPEESKERRENYPADRGAPHEPPHVPSSESHSHHQPFEQGIAAESAISASAMALSRLAEIQNEQHALESIGALTLDTLIANLARPMIKEWLDQNLFPIVEGMVEKEIERIRNHLTK